LMFWKKLQKSEVTCAIKAPEKQTNQKKKPWEIHAWTLNKHWDFIAVVFDMLSTAADQRWRRPLALERDFRSTSSSAINSPQLYRRNWCHHAPTHRKQSPVQFLRMCLRIRFPGLPIAEFQSRVVKPPIPFFPISSHLLHQQQQQKPEIWIRF
jgi:hypothetical protein